MINLHCSFIFKIKGFQLWFWLIVNSSCFERAAWPIDPGIFYQESGGFGQFIKPDFSGDLSISAAALSFHNVPCFDFTNPQLFIALILVSFRLERVTTRLFRFILSQE